MLHFPLLYNDKRIESDSLLWFVQSNLLLDKKQYLQHALRSDQGISQTEFLFTQSGTMYIF